jgi:DNA-directed RNA polymerase
MNQSVFSALSKETQDWLYATQKDLEIEAVEKGIERYRELAKRGKGANPADMRLMRKWMPYLILGITKEQQSVERRALALPSGSYEHVLLHMDAEKLAFITLTSLLRCTQNPDDCTLLSAAQYVAGNVKTQLYLDVMRKRNRDVVTMLMSKRKKLDKNSVMMMKRKLKVETIKWSKDTVLRLGGALIGLAVECLDIFDTKKIAARKYGPSSGRRCGYGYMTQRHLFLKPAARDLLEKYHGDMEAMNPYGMPMIVPPVPWSPKGTEGGYTFLKNYLVKESYEGMRLTPNDKLIEAINSIQNTEWRINQRIATTMHQVWEMGGDRAGIPGRELRKIPPKPTGFNPRAKRKARWKDVTPEDRDKWMAQAEAIHNWNNKTVAARYQMLFKLDIAKRFSKYPVLYFPHQVDWRGRTYPIPAFVGPQADDTGRSLLEFAKPVALGKHGFYWLCIHVANLWGYDKEPMDVRLRMVLERCAFDSIQRIARDPISNQEWMDADDPWKLLAGIFELAECIERFGCPKPGARTDNHAAEFMSRIPVAVDGSCNGLQHYSAIGLDPVGGRATNLVPSDRPQDIYQMVADVASERIRSEAAAGNETAIAWNGKVTRKTVKRAVMTTPYGVTQQGMLRQFIADGHVDAIEGLPYRNANYLKGVVYDAVSTVVVSARLYMDWLQTVAVDLAEHDKPMQWTTPLGYTCTQCYKTLGRRQVKTTMGYIDYRVPNKDSVMNIEKQMRGIAPNFVHSLDACHLYLTVLMLREKQITDIGAVHDSYATHAGYVSTLQYTTRHTFVQMHKDSVMEKLASELPVGTPPLPPRGDLDIYGVYASAFFFH